MFQETVGLHAPQTNLYHFSYLPLLQIDTIYCSVIYVYYWRMQCIVAHCVLVILSLFYLYFLIWVLSQEGNKALF